MVYLAFDPQSVAVNMRGPRVDNRVLHRPSLNIESDGTASVYPILAKHANERAREFGYHKKLQTRQGQICYSVLKTDAGSTFVTYEIGAKAASKAAITTRPRAKIRERIECR